MKKTMGLSLAALAVCGGINASAVLAADMPTCTTIVLDQQFLKAYPEAPAACQGVAVKNGINKVHYQAKVTDISKDVVTLTFLNAYKDPVTNGRPLKFTPPKELELSVNGKKERASDLKKGDVLDFWVPEKMVGFNANPDSTDLIKFILQ